MSIIRAANAKEIYIKRKLFVIVGLKFLCLLLIFAFCVSCTAQSANLSFDKKIDVGGYSLYINCTSAFKDKPTVILEAGMNESSETWNKIQPEVSKFARVCVYDRAGLGKSDKLLQTKRTAGQIVKDLQILLEKAQINGPFILVGHSFGGLIVRQFAVSFSKNVVGMVLVDSVHEEESEKWLSIIPAEVRKQLEADGAAMQPLGRESIDVAESEKQLKVTNWRTNIPLIVLARGKASYNIEDYAPMLRSFAPKGEELRIEMQKDLACKSTNNSFSFAEKSGHFIHHDEPELVVQSIRAVIESVRSKKPLKTK